MRKLIIATFFLCSFKNLQTPIVVKEDIQIAISKSPIMKPDRLDDLIKALVKVESGGDTLAINSETGASGPLQILPVMVRDVNRIAEMKQLDKRYTMKDVWSLKKSKEIFKIYTNFYSKNADYETISRRWYGGPRGDQWESTLGYWLEVKKHL